MSIGSTIKRLRREKDITQEQLAEYLGITSRAVSQWECERAAPDISQISILCNIFGVSADSLLGIDIEQKEKRIDELLAEAKKQWELGYNSKGESILRAAHKEYPNNYRIMFDLMSCVWGSRNEPERADEYDTVASCRFRCGRNPQKRKKMSYAHPFLFWWIRGESNPRPKIR